LLGLFHSSAVTIYRLEAHFDCTYLADSMNGT
jgi:hypothetical protein